MKPTGLLLACLVIMPLSAQAGELFRWVDKSGKMNYGDTPPADAAEVVRLKISTDTGQDEDLPYETLVALQNFPVTLYLSENCGETCDKARSLLNKRGVPFSEKLLKTKQDIDALKQLSGIGGVVPVLEIGKNFLRGFLESQWNNELDIAGYPKTASYRQRVVLPAPPVQPATPETPAGEGQTNSAEPVQQ
jgi:Domain of unknown function (DUF4124)